jgi:lysophospholipase L1-like esterase
LLPEVSDSDTTNFAEPLVHVRASKNGVQLRILPLGASIVFGLQSSDGNGFRQDLRNQLTSNGYQVDYVGSNNAGSMVDNECEAWPGYVIDQVATKAESSIAFKPKLILLHVGTNDAVQNLDIQNAGQRLGVLIDRLFDAIPGVTVIASTLLPNANSNTQTNVNIYNRQIPELVRKRQTAGNHIAYVDFSSSLFGLSDLSDGTHPTDAGYHKMAGVWYQGILAANDRGWLKAPAKGIFNASDTSCNKVLPSHG